MARVHYPWRSILVPTDFSACSEAALALATDIARHHTARICLVHVSDVASSLALDAAMSPMGIAAAIGVDQQLRDNARHSLETLAARLRADGIAVDASATEGDPASRIIELADELSADLIVMGTLGRTGLEHLLVGSVAEKVVRKAPVPVLTARS